MSETVIKVIKSGVSAGFDRSGCYLPCRSGLLALLVAVVSGDLGITTLLVISVAFDQERPSSHGET